jgi:pyruvate carboxylase
MKIKRILIANRGEIAIRIARAAADLQIPAVAVYSTDDAASLHVSAAAEAHALNRTGSSAYLDMEQIIGVARDADCDAIHPGYGFLSENADFARRCAAAGIIFIGPTPEILELFGNKAGAVELAGKCGVPVLRGTRGATSVDEVREFFKSLGSGASVMIKSIYGGGGRGIRAVSKLEDIDEAFTRCRSEAQKSFGRPDVYIEQRLEKPRHIEVQVVGDGNQVIHMGLRDCTLQRRNQKLVEVSPCPSLPVRLRDKISDSALHIAGEAKFLSLGTVEFLVDKAAGNSAGFAFIEVNPRLQVEHTVTEEVTGTDLVKTQIELASGRSLESLGHRGNATPPRIYAVQMRINAEMMDEKGNSLPDEGVISVYEVPSGPGIRVDGYGYTGYLINASFDSLLAKLVVTSRSPDFNQAVAKAGRALSEFRIEGIKTNVPFLSLDFPYQTET